jgi:hypothetical protein
MRDVELCSCLVVCGWVWLIQVCCSQRIGAVAQLGEHLLCKQGVSGSIPLSSTIAVFEKTPLVLIADGEGLVFKRNKSLHRFE